MSPLPEAKKSARQPAPRKLGPAGFLCAACRLVLLPTEELAEVSVDELQALFEGDGRKVEPAEAYRHRTVRERWMHARMWRAATGRAQP